MGVLFICLSKLMGVLFICVVYLCVYLDCAPLAQSRSPLHPRKASLHEFLPRSRVPDKRCGPSA